MTITLKIFGGFLIHSELRMYLNYSFLWKTSQIDPALKVFEEVFFEGKSYLGQYLKNKTEDTAFLKAFEKTMQEQIVIFCPKIKLKKLKLYFFVQPFIN